MITAQTGAIKDSGQSVQWFKGFHRKILLWFWLAVALLLGAILITASVTIAPLDSMPAREALYDDLSHYGELIQEQLQAGRSMVKALDMVETHKGFPDQMALVMIGADGNWVSNRKKLEYPMLEVIHDMKQSRIHVSNISSFVVVGPTDVKYGDQEWRLLMLWHSKALLWRRLFHIVTTHPILIVMAFSASALLCLLLVISVISPLRMLQRRVRQVAVGDLQTRLPSYLTQRKDEVGELCRDFNIMAERLEVMDQTKQRLLRDVSHELRSPLTRMQLALALARSKAGDAALSEHERMERDIDRLNDMIGQLLQWSRMITAAFDKPKDSFSVDRVLRDLVDNADFEAAMNDKSVVLMRCDQCSLYGDEASFTSSVENIVRNAIRFAPQDSRVEVRLKRTEDEVYVEVRDYGPGVPEDDLKHLFEPFYRVDETRGGDNSGTGLGMAIAKAAIDGHKGTIVSENAEPGLRTTIRIPMQASGDTNK